MEALRAEAVELHLLLEPHLPVPVEAASTPRLLLPRRCCPLRQLGWLEDETRSRWFRSLPVDLIHITSPFDLSLGWPQRPGPAWVATLHDLHALDTPLPGWRKLLRGVYRWKWRKLQSAARLLCVSDVSAAEAASRGYPREQLDVTWLGVAQPAAVPSPSAGQRLMVFPAWPRHKNLQGLIRALRPLGSEAPPLLIAGQVPDEFRQDMDREAGELDLRWTGSLSDRQLTEAWGSCRGLIFPSLKEGFGLTVLEAMAHGCPVACSDLPPISTVAGEAALLFDPRSPESIRGAALRLYRDADLRSRLVELGRRRSQEFSWRQTAAATLASYRQALQRKSGD